jgi:twitching motility protein PilT
MTKLYSGGALDGVSSVVLSLGGDRLQLQTGQAPAAFAGPRALRLTLPATSNSMLRALCGEMGEVHQARSSAESESRFAYAAADGTRFEVTIRGVLADHGQATIVALREHTASSTHERPSETGASETEAKARAPAPPPIVCVRDIVTVRAEPAPLDPGSGLDAALAQVIRAAISMGASDLHLTEGARPVFRVQGRLQAFEGAPFAVRSLLPDEVRRARVLAGEAVDLAFTFEGTHRLRVNVYRAEQGLCAAVRILQQTAPELSQLGLPEEVTALTGVRDGLLLFCGQTGAGKSTSLAALTRAMLESTAALCISLESPIEYDLTPRRGQSLVRQREVGQHVTQFAAGLRDALREDPDLILIGEMRDQETAALALTAAETGHLVLSSLHCRGAASAVQRIVDLYPGPQQGQARAQLGDSLRAVVSQQLLPGRRGEGQVVAVEVLTVNAAAAHLIREGKTEQLSTVMHSGKHAGMLPLERDLARLVKAGRVERSVARGCVRSPELFDQWV